MVLRDVAWRSIMYCAVLLVQSMAASSQTQFTSLNDQNTSTLESAFVARAAGKLYVESQLGPRLAAEVSDNVTVKGVKRFSAPA